MFLQLKIKIAWKRVSAGDENLIIPSHDLFASLVSLRACSNGVFSKYLAKCDREKSILYSNVSDHSLLFNVHAWQFVQTVSTKVGLYWSCDASFSVSSLPTGSRVG